MKTISLLIICSLIMINTAGQADKSGVLENLEKGQGAKQQQQDVQTATLKSAARLFEAKDDLTSVLTVLPIGSSVTILSSDSTHYKVRVEDTEGFILRKHAVIDDKPAVAQQAVKEPEPVRGAREVEEPEMSRFDYLENKYGTNTATRINAGKIWKGMNGEMVRDSWGNPQKISRVINNNSVEEEWTYKGTQLYFRNNKLVEWGPVK